MFLGWNFEFELRACIQRFFLLTFQLGIKDFMSSSVTQLSNSPHVFTDKFLLFSPARMFPANGISNNSYRILLPASGIFSLRWSIAQIGKLNFRRSSLHSQSLVISRCYHFYYILGCLLSARRGENIPLKSWNVMSCKFYEWDETRPDVRKTNSLESVRKTTLQNEMIFLACWAALLRLLSGIVSTVSLAGSFNWKSIA